MTLKLKGSRLEAEVDKCRTECNWKRLGELLPAVRQKHSGLEKYGDILEAEYIIETFVEKHSEFIEPKKDYATELQKARTLLKKAIDSELSSKPSYNLEMNLLLAKLHYYCAEFHAVLKDVENSKVEEGGAFPTLPSLRLAAEAYAVKGFSLEATLNSLDKAQQDLSKMRALFYFENSAYLTLEYIKGRDGLLNSNTRSSSSTLLSLQPTGSNAPKQSVEKSAVSVGDLLESSLERVPVLKMRQSFCDEPPDLKGIEWYRHIMTSLCDKSIGEKLQQRLSRQLAEVLLQKAPDYVTSNSLDGKSLNAGCNTDGDGNYFNPASRIEEVLLLLLISEVLASRDVVLSRAEDLSVSRHQSVQNAKSVYNLLTLVLSTLRQYELLASIYERAMKFVNEDRYIWFQFALTLMCHGRWVRASRILQQCLAVERHDENALVEHMHAARVEIEHLRQYDEAIAHAEEAIKLSEDNWLSGRCHLLRAIAFSLKADHEVQYKVRKEMYAQALKQFEEAVSLDPHDALVHYYCARQYAIIRDLRTARERCDRALELNGEMTCALMLLALISTATKDYEMALDFISDALLNFPTNFALLVLRLKLDAKLGRIGDALETSKHLLYFWRSSEMNSTSEGFSSHSEKASKSNALEVRSSVARSLSSRDAFIPVMPVLTAPMGIIAPTPIVTPLSQNGDQDGGSTFGGGLTIASELGAATSTFSDGLNSGSSVSSKAFTRFRNQANIWVVLAELFIERDRLDDVRICVDEASSIFPNSYQTLYLKGKLLSLRAGKETDEKVVAQLHSEAKVCLLGALALAPSHIASLKQLASIYYSERNILMAEKMLKDILQIDPLYGDSWQLLGIVLSEAGRYEEAFDCLRTASNLENSTPLIPFSSIPITFDSY